MRPHHPTRKGGFSSQPQIQLPGGWIQLPAGGFSSQLPAPSSQRPAFTRQTRANCLVAARFGCLASAPRLPAPSFSSQLRDMLLPASAPRFGISPQIRDPKDGRAAPSFIGRAAPSLSAQPRDFTPRFSAQRPSAKYTNISHVHTNISESSNGKSTETRRRRQQQQQLQPCNRH